MPDIGFPPLPLAEWQSTRDAVQAYARILGKVRQSLTPPQAHWWHTSLSVAPDGLTTGDMIVDEETEETLEVKLDLVAQRMTAVTSQGRRWAMPLSGQPARLLADSLLLTLMEWDIYPEVDRRALAEESTGRYDGAAAQRYLQALSSIHSVWQQWKRELPGRTGPVRLWPHHFDLSLLWFSGNLVPGVDAEDEEQAEEQMAFGFSTGDEAILAPYFYITAYPWPEDITQAALPAPAQWYTESWKGALLMYADVAAAPDPAALLLAYLRAAHSAGEALMLE